MYLTWATYRGPYILDADAEEWSSAWTKAFLRVRLRKIAQLFSFQRRRHDSLPSWHMNIGPLFVSAGLEHGWDFIYCGEAA